MLAQPERILRKNCVGPLSNPTSAQEVEEPRGVKNAQVHLPQTSHPSPTQVTEVSLTPSAAQLIPGTSGGNRAEIPGAEPDPGFLSGSETQGKVCSLRQCFPLYTVG